MQAEACTPDVNCNHNVFAKSVDQKPFVASEFPRFCLFLIKSTQFPRPAYSDRATTKGNVQRAWIRPTSSPSRRCDCAKRFAVLSRTSADCGGGWSCSASRRTIRCIARTSKVSDAFQELHVRAHYCSCPSGVGVRTTDHKTGINRSVTNNDSQCTITNHAGSERSAAACRTVLREGPDSLRDSSHLVIPRSPASLSPHDARRTMDWIKP